MSAGDANSARSLVHRAQALAALLPRTLRIGEREVSGAWIGQALPKERGGATSQDEAELLGPGGVRLWLYRLVLGPGKPPRIHMQAQFPDAGDYYTMTRASSAHLGPGAMTLPLPGRWRRGCCRTI